MKFKKITIENFRNFEYAELDLYNKNIIFGRNDFGKTNFLHALRFLFDPSIRNKGFQLSDYHKRNKDQPIKIVLELDVSEDSNDNKFIRARVHGAMVFSEGPLYIQLEGDFDQSKQLGNPVLKWGGSLNELEEINQRGIYSDLDRIFEVVYLSPNLSPKELFDKHRGLLYKNKKTNKNVEIEKSIKDLNELIGSDERVKSIGTQLSEKYNDIRKENIEIKLKSEHEVNGIFNHLTPYIQDLSLDDEHLYPTAGDGRQKILAYALTNLIEELKLEEKSDLRIPIYLMEEIENSLHPSMQQVISRHLFQTNVQAYPYLFITTHSEHLFVYMDDVNLIRIYKQEGAKLENKSMFFQVPNAFNAIRKIYNETLSQAFFYDRVLLVEGMSEKILFEAVIEKLIMEENYINPTFLEKKAKILSIEGIGFKDYVTILDALGINVMIKTDNDIRKVKTKEEVSLLGINRCRELNAKMNHSDVVIEKEVFAIPDGLQHDVQKDKEKIKRKVFEEFKDEIDQWKENKIYLSEVELEEDLKGVLSSAVTGHSMFEGGFVAYLQEAKKKNMNEFVSQFLDADNAKEIINSERFSCLKNLVGDELNEIKQPIDQEARDAIISSNFQNYLITASAGSGKTTLLVEKSFKIIESKYMEPYQQVAMITFTRLATRQLNERIQSEINKLVTKDKQLLNLNKFKVSTTESFVISEIIKPFLREAYGVAYPKGSEISQNYNLKFSLYNQGLENLKKEHILGSYKNGKKNFIYQLALKVLEKSRNAQLYLKAKYPYVMIDEYQDVDEDMHNLFMYLKDNLKISLFLVGDIKQLLFEFRGANESITNSLIDNPDFQKQTLIHNFRSHMSIVKYSYRFFQEELPIPEIYENRVHFYSRENVRAVLQQKFAQINSSEQLAYIFARRDIWEKRSGMFEEEGFVFIAESPLNSSYPNYDVLEPLLKLYFNPIDYNIYNVMDDIQAEYTRSNIGKMDTLHEKLSENPMESLSVFEEILKKRQLLENEKIKFIETLDEQYRVNFSFEKYKRIALTIHTAKGLEFDHVLIDADSFFYRSEFQKENHYVAITRPKSSLNIIINKPYANILREKEIEYNIVSL